ncbi:MAG TPA: helix-turn-helix domain-containing protein [Thermodesulfobacteriota bacterium]|nr:helix-turn-helix domain-containing protein [Thermodesulfobacteriota bacterium]
MSLKGIKDQTHYEVLEVSHAATPKEIQRAYEQAKETFDVDSVAIYSLFSEGEVREIQEAIEEAHRILMDEGLRSRYDQSHFPAGGELPTDEPSEAREGSEEKKVSLSLSGLSFNVEKEVYRGKVLKEVRERMGVEAQTISQETKISMRSLEWIEEEAFEKLPPLVYLKGFLKSYAQSLGLDPQRVIEEYVGFMEKSRKE